MSAHLATMSMGRKRLEVSASRDPSSDVPELPFPKGPCTQMIHALTPKYLYIYIYRDAISVHGPFGFRVLQCWD